VSCWIEPIFLQKDLLVNDLSKSTGNFRAITQKRRLNSNLGYEIANIVVQPNSDGELFGITMEY